MESNDISLPDLKTKKRDLTFDVIQQLHLQILDEKLLKMIKKEVV